MALFDYLDIRDSDSLQPVTNSFFEELEVSEDSRNLFVVFSNILPDDEEEEDKV